MSKFKVGDRIYKVRDRFHGNYGTIESLSSGTAIVKYDNGQSNLADLKNIRLANETIVIYANSNTAHAILKQGNQVIKRAKAICNPSDEFNFEVGANIAFQRLVGNDIREDIKTMVRQAKVGEWIKVVEAKRADNCYYNNDILQVSRVADVCGVYVKTKKTHRLSLSNKGESYLLNEEYVVLENYQPQQEPFNITKVSDEDLLIEVHRRMELK